MSPRLHLRTLSDDNKIHNFSKDTDNALQYSIFDMGQPWVDRVCYLPRGYGCHSGVGVF